MADIYSDTGSSRTITAFFDSRDDAQHALDRLAALGLPEGSAKLVRGNDATAETGDNENRGFWESLSDFFFPDDDRATYAEGLRRGGFLVTARDIPSDKYDEALDILDDEGSVDVDARSAEWRSEGWTGSSHGGSGAIASDLSVAGTSVGASAYSGAKLSDRTSGDTDLGGVAGLGASATGGTYAGDSDLTAGRDDTYLRDEAVTSSSAPIASGAAALDSSYDELSTRATARGTGAEEVIPVVEERLRVGKRDTDLGRVRVRAYTVSEPVSEAVNLHSERVFVERRPVDRALSGDEATFTDRTIEANEHREEAVVSKEARVKEEIALRKESDERTETVSDSVRRTEVEIEDERVEVRREGTTGDIERR